MSRCHVAGVDGSAKAGRKKRCVADLSPTRFSEPCLCWSSAEDVDTSAAKTWRSLSVFLEIFLLTVNQSAESRYIVDPSVRASSCHSERTETPSRFPEPPSAVRANF